MRNVHINLIYSQIFFGLVCHRQGKDVTLLTYGKTLDNCLAAAEILSEQGVEATVLRLLELSQLPVEAISAAVTGNHLVVVEEISRNCGIAPELSVSLQGKCRVHGMDLGADFVTHGSLAKLYSLCGLDADAIAAKIREVLTQ